MTNLSRFYKATDDIFYVHLDHEMFVEHYESNYVLVYLLSGSCVNQAPGKNIRFEAGSHILITKNHLSKFRICPENRPGGAFKALNVVFSDDTLKRFFLFNSFQQPPHSKTAPFKILNPHPLLQTFTDSLKAYADQGLLSDNKLVIFKLQECLHILTKVDPELYGWLFDFDKPAKIDLREFMSRNYMHNVPIPRLAKLSGRSVSTFRRDFVKEFGTTPAEWILSTRLEKAYAKLTQEKKKPSQVYLEVGFETLSHFSRSFKRKYRIPPSALSGRHSRK